MILSREQDTSGIAPKLLEGGPARGFYWALVLVALVVIGQILLGLVVGVVAMVVVAITPVTLADAIDVDSAFSIGTMAALEALFFAVALFAASGFRPLPVGLTWRGAGRSLLWLAPLIGVMALLVASDPVTIRAAIDNPLIGWIVILCLFIGLFEELVFRGLLVGMLGGRSAPYFAAITSALLFGMLHLFGSFQHGWWQPEAFVKGLTIAGLFGIPFALVYLRTGSLAVLVIVHAAWDAILFGGMGVERSMNDTSAVGSPWAQLLLPALVSGYYLAWYALTDGETVQRVRHALRRRQPRTSVDWDALAEDDVVNPWVTAQLRKAGSQ